MDALDATPDITARAGYAWVRVTHCRSIIQIPIRWLPARPLREMRFRCKRCGTLLSASAARAEWAWLGEADKRGDGPKPVPWDEVPSSIPQEM
ncbi:hypothetical protein V5F44_19725 [Xanthobacter sp. V2C-8]|uniref:hypothetical protein n=1 Tax=Xanthobacter albus TaxID=3119929 RepID=UPI00372BD402